MNAKRGLTCTIPILLVICVGGWAHADGFGLEWSTVDAGGIGGASGDGFGLSATIGQPDAGLAMAGGGYTLAGGFWPGALIAAYERGDLNCDGQVDLFDIDPFVLALTDEAGYNAAFPDCDPLLADIDGNGEVDLFDIDPFVELLT